MSWTFEESDDVEELKRRICFLQSCLTQRGDLIGVRPRYVPERIRVLRRVVSEASFIFAGTVEPGLYFAECNQWGAISVASDIGRRMGIRPAECVVLSMAENPHIKQQEQPA